MHPCIKQGVGCSVAADVEISPEATLVLGDFVHIGSGVRIVGKGTVAFGDYSKLHADCFVSVPHTHSVVTFGCNTWIGERTVLDGLGGLHAGHNIGIGIGSQLYSHIGHGDTMAGCKYMAEKPLIIGNDAWFVGQCLVSPVTVGEKSVALLGSCITHDMQPNSVYAGVPAKDMTEKMGRPWNDRPIVERLALFEQRVNEFCVNNYHKNVPIKGVESFPDKMSDDVTYFNVASRTYTKRLTPIETEFMAWFTSWRGRFIPELENQRTR